MIKKKPTEEKQRGQGTGNAELPEAIKIIGNRYRKNIYRREDEGKDGSDDETVKYPAVMRGVNPRRSACASKIKLSCRLAACSSCERACADRGCRGD